MTSVELTKLYLARLKRYDPTLHFVINLTEERALTQAATADREMAGGKAQGAAAWHSVGCEGSCWQ